jgi:methylmalonyl-CoA/ethylmalonyl-CoA epimerase
MLNGAEFHHIGLVCRSFEPDQLRLEALGYRQESEDVHDPIQRVHVRFLVGGGPRIELVRADGTSGPLESWLKTGSKIYHMAYFVDCIDNAVEEAVLKGCKVLVAPVPAAAFGGKKISFVMMPNMLLVEFIQKYHVPKRATTITGNC